MEMRPQTVSEINVSARTEAVLRRHQDAAVEGRPLYLLLGGAAVAVVSLAFIGMLAYRTWYEHSIDPDRAYFGISLLFAFYVGGIFLFCYAYELYDTGKALRLTIIAAFISVVGLALIIFALSSLAKLKGLPGVATGAAEGADSLQDGSMFNVLAGIAGGREAERRSGSRFDPYTRPEDQPFIINCRQCGEMFSPAPPKAVCPHCGVASLPS
jgi:hypothetical protein